MQNLTDKKYIISVLTTVASVLLLASLLNYFIDPAHLFRGGTYEHGIVELLQQGNNVANISNYDERLFQKYYVQNLQKGKDVIVLGSSRSMQIRSELFKTNSFFNASVSGSSSEDYLSIFDIYYRHGFVPKKLVLGVDPWVFNSNSNQTRWRGIQNNYYDMLKLIGISSISHNNTVVVKHNVFKQLISWGYLRESFSHLVRGKVFDSSREQKYYPTNSDTAAVTVKRVDGSLYEASYENKTPDEINESVIAFSISPYSLQKFTEINMKASQELVKFIQFLNDKNVEVIIFLAPYHPYVYKNLVYGSNSHIIDDAESHLRNIAEKYHIPLIGSYNPDKSSCVESEFYDGMHPKEICVNKIFKSSLLNGY